ncbi:MAG: NAD(P)-dependent oxidoreductase [bacterium]|nr:NAD(P)-dependent oxidoreductase [bacterium]
MRDDLSIKNDDLFSRTLVTGSSGLIGSYVDFGIKTDRKILDVTNLKQVFRVVHKYRPKTILHLAAFIGVEQCEQNPERAYMVNSIGAYYVALAAKEIGAKFVYVSSSVVFDGKKDVSYTEEDVPNPQNVYGKSKHIGELVVQSMLKDYLIIRSGRLYGGDPNSAKNLVAQFIRQLSQEEIKAASDKMCNLTYAQDFVTELKKLIAENKKGIYHIVNKDACSPYDIAKEIVKTMHKKIEVVPVTEAFAADALRGKFEVIGVKKLKSLRSWRKALREYLEVEILMSKGNAAMRFKK